MRLLRDNFLAQFRARELAHVAWGFARLGYVNRVLARALARRPGPPTLAKRTRSADSALHLGALVGRGRKACFA